MARYDVWFEKNYGSKFAGKPFLFIAEEKHVAYYHLCSNADDVQKVSLYTVQRRLNEGWYESDMSEQQLNSVKTNILDKKDGWGALGLLMKRTTYEYENVSIEEFDSYE